MTSIKGLNLTLVVYDMYLFDFSMGRVFSLFSHPLYCEVA